MSKQIFKQNVPKSLLFELLELNCVKKEKCYLFTLDAYKKGLFNESIPKFLEECRPYYHLSKQKYLDLKTTYNSFATVLRQICNHNLIVYSSQIKYSQSKYDIIYYVYF
jgi:hypothetical protein